MHAWPKSPAWSCWYGAESHSKCTIRYKYQAGGKSMSALFTQQTVQLSEGRPWKVSEVLKRNITGAVIKGLIALAVLQNIQYLPACRLQEILLKHYN